MAAVRQGNGRTAKNTRKSPLSITGDRENFRAVVNFSSSSHPWPPGPLAPWPPGPLAPWPPGTLAPWPPGT